MRALSTNYINYLANFWSYLTQKPLSRELLTAFHWHRLNNHVAYRFVHSSAILSCSFLSLTYCVAILPTNGSAENVSWKQTKFG